MKLRYLIAFFLTVLLYFLLAFLLWPMQKQQPNTKRTVTTLNLATLTLKKPKPKPLPTPQPKPMPKPSPKPKPLLKPKPQPKSKSTPKPPIKQRPKRVKPPKVASEEHNVTKKPKPKTTAHHAPSLASLFAQKPKKSQLQGLPKEYRKLYKDEFDSFTKKQKEFLQKNLSRIGAITQKYLYLRGYPYIAIKTRQQGTNVVEFYLHPNGDISGLKLIGSSGYEALDKNTIETIKAAYKDYPLPKEKTKIRIYVKYSLIY